MNRPLRVAAFALLASLFALAVTLDFPLCPLASAFGIPCPGCGLTRATLALLRGDLRSALHFHPLVWLLTPLFTLFMASAAIELLRNPARTRDKPRSLWHGRGSNAAALLLLAVTLGVWLARFAGHLGGPVAVMSLRDWLTQR